MRFVTISRSHRGRAHSRTACARTSVLRFRLTGGAGAPRRVFGISDLVLRHRSCIHFCCHRHHPERSPVAARSQGRRSRPAICFGFRLCAFRSTTSSHSGRRRYGPLVCQAGCLSHRPPAAPAIRQPGVDVVQQLIHHALAAGTFFNGATLINVTSLPTKLKTSRAAIHPPRRGVAHVATWRTVVVGEYIDRGPGGFGDEHPTGRFPIPPALVCTVRCQRQNCPHPAALRAKPGVQR